MKTGMNLLLWTTELTPEHDGLLDQIKAMGFDSVEVPVFALDDPAPYDRLGKRLKSLGLAATAVTVMSPETNPISPDPAIREAAVAHLDRVLDRCAAVRLRDPLRADPLGHRPLLGDGADRRRVPARRRHPAQGRRDRRRHAGSGSRSST